MAKSGSSLLHLNAFKGNVEILKDLLGHGLDPFQPNKQGDTSMHIACRRGLQEFIYEVTSWCLVKGITAAQADVEN